MINTAVCLFPDTLLKEELVSHLVQVFQKLVYLQPVENEPLSTTSPLLAQLAQEQRLQPLTPLPLGEQRERFLALLEDMRRYGQDYLSQLSFLTLAEMSHQRGLESRHSIVGELLSRSRIRVASDEEEAMLLWQSRLILKLGEMYDIRQAELQTALRSISERQQALLTDLQGDMDETEDLLPQPDLSPESGLSDLLKYRLRAWTRLFFSGQAEPQPVLFVTTQEAALDLICEVYSKRYGQEARSITEFNLADAGAANQQANGEALLTASLAERLGQDARDLLVQGAESRPEALSLNQHRRVSLHFYAFPGCSAQELFHQSFCHDTGAAGQGLAAAPEGIVGLIRLY